MEHDLEQRARDWWRELPIGAWFFEESPECLHRFSVMERTSGGSISICSTSWHHEKAKRDMQDIARFHNDAESIRREAWEQAWISVAEKVPEFSAAYLVAVTGIGDDGEQFTGSLSANWSVNDKRWYDLKGWGHDEVTYWMPLPSPPRSLTYDSAHKEKP